MWAFVTILFGIVFYYQMKLLNKLESKTNHIPAESNIPKETVRIVNVPVFNKNTQHVDSYRQVGVLHAQGSVLPLLGRRVHSGSTNWNYYTLTNDAMSLRIPLTYNNKMCTDTTGCNELYDNDTVSIPELGATFTVRMYQESPHTYNPYVY
jgi:hypothetical protein